MNRWKWTTITLCLLLSIICPLAYIQSQQLETFRTILNSVWDRDNHRLMVLPWAGATGTAETETTIFNDVWDKDNHRLMTNSVSTSGAPTDAHYVTTRAESGLSAERNLGALTSGILYQTVSGGESTPGIVTIGTGLSFNSGTLSNSATISFTDGNGFDGTVTDSALSLTTSLTAGSVPFICASGHGLCEDNTSFNWVSGTGLTLKSGGNTLFFDVGNELIRVSTGAYAELSYQTLDLVYGFNDAAPGDFLGRIRAQSKTFSDVLEVSAQMRFLAESTPVESGGTPTRIVFDTQNAGVLKERYWITTAGAVNVTSPDAASTHVFAGQVEVQGSLLLKGSGGTSQVLKQTSAGGVVTVARLACADLSDVGTGCSGTASAVGANPSTSIGLSVVNGSASTFMRSDAAPALDQSIAPTWTGIHQFNSASLKLKGATSGTTTLNAAATAGTTTITLPGGTTDFSATGGASQVVKQTSAGGAFTVARLACADLSDAAAGCSSAGGSGTVNSGTSGQIAYYASTGTAVSGLSPFTTDGSSLTLTRNSLGTTSTDGIVIANTTAAANGAQQISPRLHFGAKGWTGSASEQADWVVEVLPVQGSSQDPTAHLKFGSIINNNNVDYTVLFQSRRSAGNTNRGGVAMSTTGSVAAPAAPFDLDLQSGGLNIVNAGIIAWGGSAVGTQITGNGSTSTIGFAPNGTLQWNTTSSYVVDIHGAQSSSAAGIRFAKAGSLVWRNTAGNADLTAMIMNTSGNNDIHVGTSMSHVGLFTSTNTTLVNDVGIKGTAARAFGVERNTTSNTAGNAFTISSEGATSAATDKNGGDLILAPGTATGTGKSKVQLQSVIAGATGTTDRTATTHFQVTQGHIESLGTAPTISSGCGTGASIVGTDVAGTVTTILSGFGTCTITFANAWANTPKCFLNDQTSAVAARAVNLSTTAFDFSSVVVGGDVVDYHCIGRS